MRVRKRALTLVTVVAVLLGLLPAVTRAAAQTPAKPNDHIVCTTYWVIGARGSGEGYDGNERMGLELNLYGSYAAGILPARRRPSDLGQHTEFRLGYLLARAQLSRTASDDGHHHSTNGGGLPSGFRLEAAFGHLRAA